MMRLYIKQIFFLLLLVFGTFQASCLSSRNLSRKKVIDLPLKKIEIADTEAERNRGLMFRRSLCTECAMLFVFEEEGIYPFWMKDTYLPLDIIFLSEEGRIITMHKGMTPLNEIKTYAPSLPVKYAVEVNAGYIDRNHLKEGVFINILKLFDRGNSLLE